ncbi:MAG: hypothetical protein GY711_03625 [bacterium]|nr:hypothetical protein [bacterium]
MKLITIHPLSALSGAAALAALLSLFSMAQAPAALDTSANRPTSFNMSVSPVLSIKGIPAPEQMMHVTSALPFTVPMDKIFVATGLGTDNTDAPTNRAITVAFDGVNVLAAPTYKRIGGDNVTGLGPAIPVIPPGLTAPAGTVVSVSASHGTGIVMGYLADA